MKKHVITHIHCLDHPSVLRLVQNLIDYNHIFTGYKIATITKSSKEPYIHQYVKNILINLDYFVVEVSNDPHLREASHFFTKSLPLLLTKTEDGVVYYCHSKGIIYHPQSEDGQVTSLWTDVLLHYTLHKHDKLPFDSLDYDTFGTCIVREKNFLPDHIGEDFCFVGTFFWIKLNVLIRKKFKPHSKFYLEGLPGLVCKSERAFNLGPVLNSQDSPYRLPTWNKRGIYYGFPRKDSID